MLSFKENCRSIFLSQNLGLRENLFFATFTQMNNIQIINNSFFRYLRYGMKLNAKLRRKEGWFSFVD